VRDSRIARILIVLICLGLLLLSSAGGPLGVHVDLALPVLVFCFFAVPTLARLRAGHDEPTAQPLSLVAFQVPRAPPLA
jgi:hypothetical protein